MEIGQLDTSLEGAPSKVMFPKADTLVNVKAHW